LCSERGIGRHAFQRWQVLDDATSLVDQEILYRDNRRLARLLKAAKLRVGACVEDIDYRHPRGIERSFMSTLASCQWIARHQNLTIAGPAGSGKTWLACALGNQACRLPSEDGIRGPTTRSLSGWKRRASMRPGSVVDPSTSQAKTRGRADSRPTNFTEDPKFSNRYPSCSWKRLHGVHEQPV
jgi:hypothetical protein